MQTYWTAIRTKFRREETVARGLDEQGFTRFVPQFRNTLGRVELMFPRYLFVVIDLTQRWQAIRSTKGVAKMFLRENETPVRIPDREMLLLQQLVDAEGIYEPARPHAQDSRVYVMDTSHTLHAVQGRVMKILERGHCEVLFSILGKRVVAQLRDDQLEAVAA